MDGVLGGAIQGAIIGAVVGGSIGLVLVLIKVLGPKKKCPDCGADLPTFRAPASGRQAAWGGTTCPKCGCEVDRKGNKIRGD